MIKKAILLISFSLFCISLNAQKLKIGNGISTLVKSNSSKEHYHRTGFGFNTNLEYGITESLAIKGEASLNHWTSRAIDDDQNSISIMAGLKANALGPIYVEARTGYYFEDMDNYALIPAIGARFGGFDLNAGYQVAGVYKFTNIRLAYFWWR